MKKAIATLVICSLLAVTPALAEQDLTGLPIADGVVASAAFTDITAPFSGTLASFDLSVGDAVASGQTLMRYVTNDVFASEAGVVKAVFAATGDDATAVTARYGGLVGLEPAVGWQVLATTEGAAAGNEYKILHLGETLYFKTTGNNGSDGVGRVVAVSGKAYTVDVLTGDFDLNDSVTLYRRDNYAAASCVGKGDVNRREALLFAGAGRVADVAVREGETVTAGQKLFSLVSADAAPAAAAPDVLCQTDGVVEQVLVAPGQQVWKGQALLRVDQTDMLEVRADVDEADLGTLAVGDLVPVTLDMQPNKVLMATVTRISALGVSRQNAAYFTVRASLPAGSGLLGASASMYLPAAKE